MVAFVASPRLHRREENGTTASGFAVATDPQMVGVLEDRAVWNEGWGLTSGLHKPRIEFKSWHSLLCYPEQVLCFSGLSFIICTMGYIAASAQGIDEVYTEIICMHAVPTHWSKTTSFFAGTKSTLCLHPHILTAILVQQVGFKTSFTAPKGHDHVQVTAYKAPISSFKVLMAPSKLNNL